MNSFFGQTETNWWNTLFQSESERAGELRLQWLALPESWGVFVWILIFAAIIGGAFWLYRRESEICPPRIRLLLAGLRISVLLFLLVLLFKPSVYFQEVNILRPAFALLRDSSLSLDKTDRYTDDAVLQKLVAATGLTENELRNGTVSRSQLINQSFTKSREQTVDAWREKGSVQVVDFSDRMNPVAMLPAANPNDPAATRTTDTTGNNTDTNNTITNNAPADNPPTGDPNNPSPVPLDTLPDLEAAGLGTDIWQALRQTLDDTKRLVGIVLISEGQHNGSEDPVEIAKLARDRDIPIFVVGVGDPVPERNLAVQQINIAARGYMNEPFFIEGVLQASLPAEDPLRSESLSVTLLQQRLDPRTGKLGEPEPVETKATPLPATGNRIRVQFSHTVEEPGKFAYTIRASELSGETNSADNIATSSTIEVVDQKIRVLLISGLPNWDYQQLYRVLQRDSTISVSCWLQSMDETRQQDGDEPIVELPRTLEDLGQYNVVVMIDPNPEEFDADWIAMLKEFCRLKAGGLIYMAGPQYSAEFLTMNRLAGFKDILPVRFGDANAIAASQVIADATGDSGGGMQLVSFNLEHDIMKLSEETAAVQNIWAQMPGFAWNFPTLAAKPTARVLLERGDQPSLEGNQPMLVDGRFGSGTVLYFGFQGTWRWRQVGLQAQYFNGFWIQTIRYLIEHRSLQGNRRGFVDADRTEYELGSSVLLLANLVDEEFKPAKDEAINAIVTDEDGRQQKISLQRVPAQEGKYETNFKATRVGSFTVALDMATDADKNLFEPANFRVTPPTIETAATWRNEKLLRDIAEQSGGKYFSIEDLDQVAAVLPDLESRIEFDSPPQPLWDLNRWLRGLAFLFPVLLLTIEWALRKWYKLL